MVAAWAELAAPKRIRIEIANIGVNKDCLKKNLKDETNILPHFGSRTISIVETPGFADPHRCGGAVCRLRSAPIAGNTDKDFYE